MERGIRRQEIFKEEMDYQMFLAILKKVVESYEATVHAYCLITIRCQSPLRKSYNYEMLLKNIVIYDII